MLRTLTIKASHAPFLASGGLQIYHTFRLINEYQLRMHRRDIPKYTRVIF